MTVTHNMERAVYGIASMRYSCRFLLQLTILVDGRQARTYDILVVAVGDAVVKYT